MPTLPETFDPVQKADTLIEALAWIQEFRDKTTVIKLGGSLLDDVDALNHTLLDIHFMSTVGMRPVIVHGGGARISRAMQEAGIEPNFIEGRRYTDEKTLSIVHKVLAQQTNEEITERFTKIGGRGKSLNFESTPVLHGEKLIIQNNDGEALDLGFVGQVTSVDRQVIEKLCDDHIVPFIPSMCQANDGQKLNVNADTAAMTVAIELKAEKLVILSDVPGVCREKDNEDTLISSLNQTKAMELIENGTITDGMIPKVQACLETLDCGVRKVHIINGRLRHSLLLEVYTSDGIGTVIS